MSKKVQEIDTTTKYPFKMANRSSNLSMGIVGLPNVGKSTFFYRLTQNSVRAENFPFCTIDPSIGQTKIDDPRAKYLTAIYQPKKTVLATLNVIDIAGLVKGASEGQGLGNKFLDNIRNVDGIFLVTRCFDDKDIVHVETNVDPLRDIKTIKEELRIKDLEILEKIRIKAEKDNRTKTMTKKIEKELNTLKRLKEILETKWINEESYDIEEISLINTLNMLTTKNVVILANISPEHYSKRKANAHLRDVLKEYGDNVIPFSATYVEDGKDISSQLPDDVVKKIVDKGYQSLNLINFFTAGKDEVRSWTISKNDKAPRAGAAIHTDFEKYFVSADVMAYEDFLKHPSEAQMRSAGKYLQKGKEYVVNDGDIVLFKVNPPKSSTKK